MSYAGCCDRCGNLFNVGYYFGSTYGSIYEKVNNGTNLNKKKLLDLCPACIAELDGWLHIYDEEESNDDEG